MKWLYRLAFWRKRPDIEATWRKAEEAYLRVDQEQMAAQSIKADLAFAAMEVRVRQPPKRMTDAELAEAEDWVQRNGGPTLPFDLHEGGMTLAVIRDEIKKAQATAAYLQVRRVPPSWVRRLLARWLHFPEPAPVEKPAASDPGPAPSPIR